MNLSSGRLGLPWPSPGKRTFFDAHYDRSSQATQSSSVRQKTNRLPQSTPPHYRQEAETHIQVQLGDADLSHPAQVHFSTEPPDVAIMDSIEQNMIDLLVNVTLGRAGISGFITGTRLSTSCLESRVRCWP